MLEKSQAGAAADVEALMNQNQQGIYSALDLLESGNYAGLSDARASIELAQNKMQLHDGRIGFQRPHCGCSGAARRGGCRQRIHTDSSSGGGYFVSAQDSEKQMYTPEALAAASPAGWRMRWHSLPKRTTQTWWAS